MREFTSYGAEIESKKMTSATLTLNPLTTKSIWTIYKTLAIILPDFKKLMPEFMNFGPETNRRTSYLNDHYDLYGPLTT